MKRNSKGIKYIALLLSLFIPLLMIYCLIFIGSHEVHQCTGRECPVCHQIHMAETIISQFDNTSSLLMVNMLLVMIYMSIKQAIDLHIRRHTLILDKVRMDD